MHEMTQLELNLKMPKTEKKALFTTTTSGYWIFIDDERTLSERTEHHAVFQINENTSKINFFHTRGSTLSKFHPADSKKRGITINTYFSISKFLKKKNMLINKKTCEVIPYVCR